MTNCNVESIEIEKNKVKGVVINNNKHLCDIIISGADYAHTHSLNQKK